MGKLAGTTVVLAATAVATGAALLSFWPSFGGSVEGERSARVREPLHSSAAVGSRTPFRRRLGGYAQLWDYLQRQVLGSEVRTPPTPIPVVQPVLENRAGRAPPGLRTVWFGHASVYLELDGLRLITEYYSCPTTPHRFVWHRSEAVPSPAAGARGAAEIDAVVISHDHYDRLTYARSSIWRLTGRISSSPSGSVRIWRGGRYRVRNSPSWTGGSRPRRAV